MGVNQCFLRTFKIILLSGKKELDKTVIKVEPSENYTNSQRSNWLLRDQCVLLTESFRDFLGIKLIQDLNVVA